jgi:hypothetical protein
MELKDLATRVRRLDELSRGLAKEVTLWKACNDPLLYVERKEYLAAIDQALQGTEAARVVLVKVRQRLERETSATPPSREVSAGPQGPPVHRP